MPPPSIPTVAPFTLARASDVNAIASALQNLSSYNLGLVQNIPFVVSVTVDTGFGAVPDLAASPANNITIPLTFGFTGTMTTGDIVGIDTLTGIGEVEVGGTPVGAKVLNGASGNIGFFDAATYSIPQTLNFNVELNVPVHTILANMPPDAFRRQFTIGVDSNVVLDSRLDVIEANAARKPENTYWVSPVNGDFPTLAAAVAYIGVPFQPTTIVIWPGNYTETPITLNGPITVFSLGATLNYSSVTAGISVGGWPTLYNLNVVNPIGPALSVTSNVNVVCCTLYGTTGVTVNGSINMLDCKILSNSGDGLVVSGSGAQVLHNTTIQAASTYNVVDLGSSSPTVYVNDLILEHSGVGGLNIAAGAAVTIIGGPILLSDTSVGVSPFVSFASTGSAVLVPILTYPVATATSVTVIHNLGYTPLVQVLNSTGFMVIPNSIQHTSNLQFTVTWSVAFTGTILYR